MLERSLRGALCAGSHGGRPDGGQEMLFGQLQLTEAEAQLPCLLVRREAIRGQLQGTLDGRLRVRGLAGAEDLAEPS